MSESYEGTTSSIDTNIMVVLMDKRFPVSWTARKAIEQGDGSGARVICGCVFAELMAGPQRTFADIETCLAAHSIQVDWVIEEQIWRLAGERFAQHMTRRRERGGVEDGPKRILADFLIGAHAVVRGFDLVTFDQRLFAVAFPELKLSGQVA